MKTIYVKERLKKNGNGTHLTWRKAIPTAVFLFAMFLLGRAAAEVFGETAQTEGSGGSAFSGQYGGSVQTSGQTDPQMLPDATENWGLGFGRSGEKPSGNATVETMKSYNAYYMAEGEEKVLYLTFDCGYENGNTEPILDALKKHDAPATFFVVGHFLETAPEIAKRMVEDGHTVGNHTYHHPDMSKIADAASFQKEVNDVSTLFREITGTDMAMYYRPPQGKYSTENLRMAQEMGYATFFWSLAYVDWNQDDQPSHDAAMEKLMGRIHPGAIVLLHSTSKTNGEILDEVLTEWEKMGYTFRPLSDFTAGAEAEKPEQGGGRILQDEGMPDRI